MTDTFSTTLHFNVFFYLFFFPPLHTIIQIIHLSNYVFVHVTPSYVVTSSLNKVAVCVCVCGVFFFFLFFTQHHSSPFVLIHGKNKMLVHLELNGRCLDLFWWFGMQTCLQAWL